MEGWGMRKTMVEMKEDDLGVSRFIVDGDSSSRRSILVKKSFIWGNPLELEK